MVRHPQALDPQALDPRTLAASLRRNAVALSALLDAIDDREARWKPDPARWSVLEVVVHLVDEERLDFRPRLQSLLQDPRRPWPAIDPEGWVTSKDYGSWRLADALEAFAEERRRSVQWLEGVETGPDGLWNDTTLRQVYCHPEGDLRGGDMAVAWLAHDHLHLAQLSRLRAAWWNEISGFSTRYAMP